VRGSSPTPLPISGRDGMEKEAEGRGRREEEWGGEGRERRGGEGDYHPHWPYVNLAAIRQ